MQKKMLSCSAQLGTAALGWQHSALQGHRHLRGTRSKAATSISSTFGCHIPLPGLSDTPQQWVHIPKGSLSTPWFVWGPRWEENVQFPQHQRQFWPPWLQKIPHGCWVITLMCRLTQGEVQGGSRS